jgi:hypothetical protein
MGAWQLLSLEMDSGGKDIGRFFEEDLSLSIKRSSLDELLARAGDITNQETEIYKELSWLQSKNVIFSKERLMNAMSALTAGINEPILAVYGSGFFHHYTYGLCTVASKLSKAFCYIHIDRHTDCYPSGVRRDYKRSGIIAPSDFVEDLRNDKTNNAKDVIMIGAFVGGWCKGIHSVLYEFAMDKRKTLEELAAFLDDTRDDVYISIDTDVMLKEEVITYNEDYDRGLLDKAQLFSIISLIKSRKRVVGADICGYKCSTYGFESREAFEEMRIRSLNLYKDTAELIIS